MKILAIDSSTPQSSVALSRDDKIVAEARMESTPSLAEKLLPNIDEILKNVGWNIKDIEGIAVSIGPGSFTGLRIGLATAKGIALANNIPIVGVSSLEILAMNGSGSDLIVVPIIDARKKEVYTAAYLCHCEPGEAVSIEGIFPEQNILPDNLVGKLKDFKRRCLLMGDGAILYKDILLNGLGDMAVMADEKDMYPKAANIIHLACPRFKSGEVDNLASLAPNYIRRPDAELRLKS
ncbi:tRNA (adenosine(37)-N6)-threonylcarbamoyltransferase complex dimerization subunit type 1 TsaB [bacterium]|nr:tRNA (adenosine(37)-N6)-threonylcarbamoyltransferase complex dimerization subunit type 1 TsaB [bacterium]